MSIWLTFSQQSPLGDSIRERRIESGWTQAELTERTSIPQADISRIENGRLDARWSTIRRISTALATTEQPRRRRLAHGGTVTDVPVAPRARWQPKQRTAEIADRAFLPSFATTKV